MKSLRELIDEIRRETAEARRTAENGGREQGGAHPPEHYASQAPVAYALEPPPRPEPLSSTAVAESDFDLHLHIDLEEAEREAADLSEPMLEEPQTTPDLSEPVPEEPPPPEPALDFWAPIRAESAQSETAPDLSEPIPEESEEPELALFEESDREELAFRGDDLEIDLAPPWRRRRSHRSGTGRGLRKALIVLVTIAVGLGAGVLFTELRDGGGPRFEREAAAPQVAPEQDVVSWAVWEDGGEVAFITIVAAGGDIDPVALGVPSYTMANIPGYGLGTVGDAVMLQDPGMVAGAVENILGVRVDSWAGSSLADLGAIVDAVGGIDVGERTFDGAQAVQYLRRGGDDVISAEFQFLAWQEVLAGILAAVDGRPGVLAALPPEVATVLTEAGSGGAEVLELPVEDIGSGLARPDSSALATIVSERFVPTSKVEGDVRLVILNGEGTPGIGERVARVLVPSGFRLVSSLNAPTFDVQETQIVASNEDFLDEAEVARDLLGVGQVFLGEQPTGVADVTVVIGADFGGQ